MAFSAVKIIGKVNPQEENNQLTFDNSKKIEKKFSKREKKVFVFY